MSYPTDAEEVSSSDGKRRFEIAISFLKEDEPLALELSDRFTERFTVFVYSKHQADVVGRNTDGVEAFTNAFRHESRVCVVLHRAGWGKTAFTQIEEAAIKERALNEGEGWDFLIVACLDDAKPAKWIPSTKVWYGLRRYGLEGLVAAIDNRITELGGRPSADTVVEKAARLRRHVEFEEAQRAFISSQIGFDAAESEVASFERFIEKRAGLISAELSLLSFRTDVRKYYPLGIAADSRAGSFALTWLPTTKNSLRDAELSIVEYSGHFSFQGGVSGGPKEVGRLSAELVLDYGRRPAWKVSSISGLMTSERLVDVLYERLLDRLSHPKTGLSESS